MTAKPDQAPEDRLGERATSVDEVVAQVRAFVARRRNGESSPLFLAPGQRVEGDAGEAAPAPTAQRPFERVRRLSRIEAPEAPAHPAPQGAPDLTLLRGMVRELLREELGLSQTPPGTGDRRDPRAG